MDFDQIRSFVAVARHRSFTLAASERDLTQPGLSRQVQKLERDLGVTLLERGASGVSLTPAGGRFLAYAERLLDEHARMLIDLHAAPTLLEGNLRIAASTTPGAYLVPGYVAGFRERYPRVWPEVTITDSAAVVAAVQDGRWDVGFTGGHVRDPALQAVAVAEDEIVLAARVDHPLAKRDSVSLADLSDVPFLDREDGSGTLQSLRAALAARGVCLPPRRVVMVLSSCQAIVSAVHQGLGVGFASTLALADSGATDSVVGLRLADVTVRRHLFLVYRKHVPLPPVADAFVRFVAQQLEATGRATLQVAGH